MTQVYGGCMAVEASLPRVAGRCSRGNPALKGGAVATIWVEARAYWSGMSVTRWVVMQVDPDNLGDMRRLGDEIVRHDLQFGKRRNGAYTVDVRERSSGRKIITFAPREG